jgi:hypothetical protein
MNEQQMSIDAEELEEQVRESDEARLLGRSRRPPAPHPEPPPADDVNYPMHYRMHPSGVECIQIVEHMSFNIGSAVQYLWRAGLKPGDVEREYRKAIWHIEREIQRVCNVK